MDGCMIYRSCMLFIFRAEGWGLVELGGDEPMEDRNLDFVNSQVSGAGRERVGGKNLGEGLG